MRHYLLAFLLSVSFFLNAEENKDDYTIIENKATTPILNPTLANRQVLKIRLKNGLEAYLISDPDVEKSSAAMTVRVGSWDEPKEYPGLAHFLEHMLFLGTKKYPQESEYDRYITEHGGTTNAFTANDNTSFMFSIDNSAFEEALDRFANFFKEPLFNPSGVARELQAIDQEYAKNRENDDIRGLFVNKEMGNPEHPFHAFNMGNSLTLTKVSQDTLKEWYHSNYSANLMRLVVISSLPLETLRKMVVENFKDVPTINRPLSTLNEGIFAKDSEGKIMYIEPIKNIRTVTLIWDLPSQFSHMKDSKPETILCYVLGHEGKLSLLADLQKERLAEKLSCGSYQLGPNNTEFYVEITLTDLGLKQVYTVIEKFFQAIANFKQKGVPRYLFDEVQKVGTLHYQYQEREEAFKSAMTHALQLAHEDMDTYPEKTMITKKFDPNAVLELLNYLTPAHARIDIIAPSKLTGIKPNKKEQWIGVDYAVESIPPAVIKSWEKAAPNPNIDLPAPNRYIPDNLSLVNVNVPHQPLQGIVPKPSLILDDAKGKIYFAADEKYLTPHVQWVITLRTPFIEASNPTKMVLGELYVRMLKEALSPEGYPASLAGLEYDISLFDNGIRIEIGGYSEKAPLLLKEILHQIKENPLTQERFRAYRDSLQREYQNFALNPPVMQASEVLKSIIYKDFSTAKQKASAIRKITYDKMSEFAKNLFSRFYVEGILYGNMTSEEGKEISKMILDNFSAEPYPVANQLKQKINLLPESGGPFYVENKLGVEGNAAILAIENPPFSFKNRAAQQILMQAVTEPFFADLRTRQQTGYLVFSQGEELEKHLFDLFAVQSNTHATRDLLARFELFIEGYLQELNTEVPEERFEKIKEALITSIKTSTRNMKSMANQLDKIAFKYDGDFDWIDKRIQGFEDLKYAEFLNYAQSYLGKQNKRRFAVLMNGLIPEQHLFQFTPVGINQLRKLSDYQTSNEQSTPGIDTKSE